MDSQKSYRFHSIVDCGIGGDFGAGPIDYLKGS
jgi:hypothetical protein